MHCFLLIKYGLSSNNNLYSRSLSFTMFIFPLTPFDTYKSIAHKKAYNIVFWSSKHKEITMPHESTFVFIRYFIGTIVPKECYQKWGGLKKYIKGG